MRRKSERIEKDDFRALSHRWKSVFERKKGWSCAEPRGRITSLLQRSAPPNDLELPTQTAKCVMESMELWSRQITVKKSRKARAVPCWDATVHGSGAPSCSVLWGMGTGAKDIIKKHKEGSWGQKAFWAIATSLKALVVYRCQSLGFCEDKACDTGEDLASSRKCGNNV